MINIYILNFYFKSKKCEFGGKEDWGMKRLETEGWKNK